MAYWKPMFPEIDKAYSEQICYTNLIAYLVNNQLVDLSDDKIESIQKLGKPDQLTEGNDYTINDQGNFVLTSWFLARKGPCCKRGCLNCPY